MLPIERRADLSTIEIGQSERGHGDGHLERLLRRGDEVPLLGWKHRSANDLVRLDHDSRGLVLDEQANDPAGICRDRLLHLNPGNGSLEPKGDAAERLSDLCQRRLARRDRNVGQVDVNGETRQIAPEEVDGGSALQGEAVLGGHVGE